MTKRWRHYPKYKPSGVEWLGEVPEGWISSRLRYLSRITTGSKNTEDSDPTGDYPFFVRSDIIHRLNTYSFDEEAIITAGDGAIAKIFHYYKGKFDAHQRVYVLFQFKRISAKFLFYYFSQNLADEVVKLSAKSTVDSLRLPMLQNFPVLLPTIPEQKVIATFLDRETARIDALIEKKERQIELLQEKRAALISHAVTKGVDPNVKMKDSGIEWLGLIPEGWEVKKIKYLSNKIGSGKTPRGGSETYLDSGILFIRSQNVQFDGLKLDDIAFISPEIDTEMATSRVEPFDLLLNITGASIGRCTLVPEDLEKANVNQHVCIIRPIKERIIPDYFNRYLSSSISQWQIFRSEEGVSREGLNFSQVSNIVVLIPSLPEQKKISGILDVESDKINALMEKIQLSIVKLREYRSALISAAVTGKIDVRDEAKA